MSPEEHAELLSRRHAARLELDAHTGCTGCGARLYDTLTDGSKAVRGRLVEVNNGEYAGIYCYECIEAKVWRKL